MFEPSDEANGPIHCFVASSGGALSNFSRSAINLCRCSSVTMTAVACCAVAVALTLMLLPHAGFARGIKGLSHGGNARSPDVCYSDLSCC